MLIINKKDVPSSSSLLPIFDLSRTMGREGGGRGAGEEGDYPLVVISLQKGWNEFFLW